MASNGGQFGVSTIEVSGPRSRFIRRNGWSGCMAWEGLVGILPTGRSVRALLGRVLDLSFRREEIRIFNVRQAFRKKGSIMGILTAIGDWIHAVVSETWNWFSGLHYQEWFVVLGIVAGLGFLCMRGFSTRDRV